MHGDKKNETHLSAYFLLFIAKVQCNYVYCDNVQASKHVENFRVIAHILNVLRMLA